jgi:hypothetical protein
VAGFVQVSEGNGVSLGGLKYIHVIEFLRQELLAKGRDALVKQIYHGHDVASMDFISLKDLGETEFVLFVDAMYEASAKSSALDPDKEIVWEELFAALRADPRWPHE